MKKITYPILLLFVLLFSCVKQPVKQPVKQSPVVVHEEHVSSALLEKYIDYSNMVERQLFKPVAPPANNSGMTFQQFDAMIDNFLTHERNSIRRARTREIRGNPILVTIDKGCSTCSCIDEDGNMILCPADPLCDPGSGSVACSGTFVDYNTNGSILFTAQLNNNYIQSSAFAISGVGGTWASVGTIQQDYYPGDITFKQYYQESYQFDGVTYTQLYVMYGDIYTSTSTSPTCIVHGMQAPLKN